MIKQSNTISDKQKFKIMFEELHECDEKFINYIVTREFPYENEETINAICKYIEWNYKKVKTSENEYNEVCQFLINRNLL